MWLALAAACLVGALGLGLYEALANRRRRQELRHTLDRGWSLYNEWPAGANAAAREKHRAAMESGEDLLRRLGP